MDVIISYWMLFCSIVNSYLTGGEIVLALLSGILLFDITRDVKNQYPGLYDTYLKPKVYKSTDLYEYNLDQLNYFGFLFFLFPYEHKSLFIELLFFRFFTLLLIILIIY